MDDPIHARERAGCGKTIADLPDDQLDRGRQVGGLVAVDLLLERVQDDDVVAAGNQLADKVAPDEACSARHQCPHSV